MSGFFWLLRRVNEPKRMKLEVTRSIMNGYFVEQNKVNDCEAWSNKPTRTSRGTNDSERRHRNGIEKSMTLEVERCRLMRGKLIGFCVEWSEQSERNS